MKIFVSSTCEDLKNERKEAIAIVDRMHACQSIAMEKFFASNHQSKDVCLNRLQGCNAVVLILGFKYGSVDKAEDISFTEIEYNTAKTLGLPVFVFQKRHTDGSWRSEETDADRSDKLHAFKSRLDAENYRVAFATPQELATEIVGAIRQYELEHGVIGIRLPAFVSYEDFFQPFLDDSKLFNHVSPFVGRNHFLERLNAFVEADKRIALIYGRGGIGKSRILLQFSHLFEERHKEWKLRFLREGIRLSDPEIRQLPARKCVVTVDDAHRREDLSALFTLAQQYPDRIKIVLSTRPQGLDYLRATLTGAGFDPREIEDIPEIEELERSDMEELGSRILGKDRERFLEPLIQVAKDSPLVLVIGGRLIAEDAIDPRMLERQGEFQRAVFDRFQDVLIGQLSDRLGAELCRNILSLISALSPIQPQTETFQECASKFLNIDKVKLIDAVGVLESSGVLFRRGYSLRITPDVLSDHILYTACLTPQGQPTGYAQKVFNALGHTSPEKVLFNLSELDWRIKRDGKRVDLLGEIWSIIESVFKEASHFQRSQILKHLERVAYLQPARTLRLVEYAIQNPSKTSGGEEWASIYQYSHEDVLNALPQLLRGISFSLDYLPRCCDLLWNLGRDDERPTNPYPEHAMRVLSDLAGYDINKPVQVNAAVLDAIERWLKEFDAHEHKHSPLDVLDPLLAKEGYSQKSQGLSISLRPFAISFGNTKQIREKAISLLSDCARSQSTTAVLRALKSLIDTLRPPHGLLGRVVSDDEIKQWLPEQMRVLEVIGNTIENTKNPIVHIQVASDLRWHAKRNTQRVIAEKADSIIRAIPDIFDLRITRAVWNRYDRDWDAEDYDKHQERVSEAIKRVANEFLGQFENGENAFDFLNDLLNCFQNLGIQAQPGYFLYSLSTADHELPFQICEHIISSPSSFVSVYLDSLLSGIRERSPSKAIELIKLAIEDNDRTLCSSVAHGYAWGKWTSSLGNDEISIIEILLTHPDKTVRHQIIEALGRFPSSQRDKAVQLALSTNINNDERLADTLCSIFDSKWGIPPDQLKTEDLMTVLSKLASIGKLDRHLYHLDEFLGYCSTRIPGAVVDLLLIRLDIAREKEKALGAEYQPLPYLGFDHGLKGVSSSPDYKDIIKRVRDRALDPSSIDYFWLPKLFAEISDNFCSTSLEVLNEWIESDDGEQVQAVGLLVKDAPSDFVLSHSQFVSRLIEKAHAVSEDCYRSVGYDLSASAFSGVRSGTPGRPFPQDVKLRDQAHDLSQKFPVGSPSRRYYLALSKRAEVDIHHKLARDEEILEG